MSLSKPYEPINPNQALSEFVFSELKKRGVKIERMNELLKVYVSEEDKDLFAVPNSGEYILRFSNKQLSPEIQKKLSQYRNIRITNYHPLIKTLEKELDYIPIQFAEFQFENKMIIKEWCKWFLPNFQKIDMKINFQDEKISKKQLVAAEIWFELKSSAGRGIFPVILKKNSDLTSKEIWYWDETFQKNHNKRRGELQSLKEIVDLKDIDLEDAIQKTFEVIQKKFSYNKLHDGAYLRRLRQLRMQQMILSKYKKENESNELISHHIRKVNELKKDVMEESEIAVNSIVLLYAPQKYVGRIQFSNSKNNEQTFFIKLQWDSDTPNIAKINYPNLGLSQKVKMSSDTPTQKAPRFKICPNCKQIDLKQNIKLVDIGEGFYCTKCVIRCTTCNQTMSSDKSQAYWRNIKILLCPDHGVKCIVSQKIIKIEESVLLVSKNYCLSQYAGECFECKSLNKASNKSNHLYHHLKEELKPYALNPDKFLCKKHYVSCEETGRILSNNDIVIISSGKKVWKEIVDSCAYCNKENSLHLKKDLKYHSFKENVLLCQKHRAICEISNKVVTPGEIVTINSEKKVAIQLTRICFSCEKNKSIHPRFLKEELFQHSYYAEIRMCKLHSHRCEVSDNIVTIEEIVGLKSGKKVAIQIAAECVSCKNIHNETDQKDSDIFHLKSEMSEFQIDKRIKACNKHSFYCWSCKSLRPIYKSRGDNSTLIMCHECWEQYTKSVTSNCIIHKFFSTNSKFHPKNMINCPNCKQPIAVEYTKKELPFPLWQEHIVKKFRIFKIKKSSDFPHNFSKKILRFLKFSPKIIISNIMDKDPDLNKIIPKILIILNKESWMIFNIEGIPFASNISDALINPIKSYYSYYFAETFELNDEND